MDRKTYENLREATYIPTSELKKLFVKKNPMEMNLAIVDHKIKVARQNKQQKNAREAEKFLMNMKEKQETRSTLEIDPVQAQRITKIREQQIESAIRSGKLKRYDPKKDSLMKGR